MRDISFGETMLKVGLTGGIACGKSYICQLFKVYGITIIDADIIAREIVEPSMPALQQIAECFGSQVLDEHGALQRSMLRNIVFSDPKQLAKLNAITHPAIHQRLLELIELVQNNQALPESYLNLVQRQVTNPLAKATDPKLIAAFTQPLDPSLVLDQHSAPPYVILDIPLLIENHLTDFVDHIVVIDVQPQIQLSRIMARDHTDETAARKVIASQISREERLKYADDVIDTSSSNIEEKRLYVLNLHRKLMDI